MIDQLTVRRFKRFAEQVFDLTNSVVLVGPNNSGKSTLLQAISTWRFGLLRWLRHRTATTTRQRSGISRQRSGVAVTRSQFTPVPLRAMNLLWEQRSVFFSPGKPRRIEIEVAGRTDGRKWSCGMEFHYHSPEVVYVRPLGAKDMTPDEFRAFPPDAALDLDVVYVPALSGIARDEQRHDPGMQDLLIGQGRPGEVLRNLLLEIAGDPAAWKSFVEEIRSLFNILLKEPIYTPAQPHIVCEYLEGKHRRPLDLSSAGSGTLQVLLVLAFLHARRGSVILLDEPDAHQHVILQNQVYRHIQSVASASGGQLIAATHSEVILNVTDPTNVIGFFASGPRTLTTAQERDRLQDALRRITTAEIVRARECGAILYVEGQSDEEILSAWAQKLDHPARKFFERPNVHWLRGRLPNDARNHFSTLRVEFPNLVGICLLDGDNTEPMGEEVSQSGLVMLKWHRYEIENYLLHPEAIKRFVSGPVQTTITVQQEFNRQVPHGIDLFGDIPALVRLKASDELLVPLLERVGKRTKKADLHQLAAVMKREEIHPEVVEKLDRIADELLPAPAS